MLRTLILMKNNLNPFYQNPNFKMKKILLLCSFFLLYAQANAQTLHLILVSDYADPAFGKVTLQNEDEIQKMFTNVSTKLSYGLKVLYLNTGNQHFNRADVVSGLRALTTNAEDIIIFYYNGYGFYPAIENSNFPSFKLIDTDNKFLSMDAVAKQLQDKNGRLVMVIADTRDTENKLIDFSRGLNPEENFAEIITKKLFLEPTGVYKIASSRKNIPSFPYFTQSFTDNFYHILEISDSDLITSLNINYLVKETQKQLSAMIIQSEVKTPQQILPTFEKFYKPVKAYLPATFEIPSPKLLKTQLDLLANSAVSDQRKKAIEIMRNMFSTNAIIEVRTENRNINIQNNEVVKMSIEDYIKQTEKYDKTMKRVINFAMPDFKRTEDFKKFSSLKIVERIK